MTDETIVVLKAKELRQIIREEMQAATAREEQPDPGNILTRRQAAKFLGVSYQTMYNWTRDEILKEHGTRRKKFYLRNELIELIKSQNNKKD